MADADVVRPYLRHASGRACEYAFANLIIWKDFDRPSYAVVSDCLWIHIHPLDEEPFYLEPLGERINPVEWSRAAISKGRLSRVSAQCAALVPAASGKCVPLEDHFDYLYCTRDIAELKGRKFDGKRNHIRRLLRRDPHAACVELKKGHAAEALVLFDAWCASKRGSSVREELPELVYSCQRRALERAFEYYDELGLTGGALVVEGRLAGFVLGSAQREDTACLHLSYTHPGVPGAFPLLLREVCRGVFSRFEFINLEQDLGLAGLRKTKRSFSPAKIEEKFDVRFGSEGETPKTPCQ